MQDIIQRNRRRIQRSGDLSALQTTLTSLKDKHKYLEEQLTQYNSYIADSMTTMQKKGHKKRFVMPFTPQWNHQRTLEKEGRKPRFGSYKYSVSQPSLGPWVSPDAQSSIGSTPLRKGCPALHRPVLAEAI